MGAHRDGHVGARGTWGDMGSMWRQVTSRGACRGTGALQWRGGAGASWSSGYTGPAPSTPSAGRSGRRASSVGPAHVGASLPEPCSLAPGPSCPASLLPAGVSHLHKLCLSNPQATWTHHKASVPPELPGFKVQLG